jgi:predicted nucleic acid-binding protein
LTKKIIIADSGPLIAFARLKQIKLLSKTLGTMIIPQAVADKCLVDLSKPGAKAIQLAIQHKLITVYDNPSNLNGLDNILGAGEAAGIFLASELHAILLIDEKLGRRVAEKMHIKIIGTAGALLLAKQKKLIKQVLPLITALKEVGYHFSESLIKDVVHLAKEKL